MLINGIITGAQVQSRNCPPQYGGIHATNNNMCFRIIYFNRLYWWDAKKICKDYYHGDLLYIYSVREHSEINLFIQSNSWKINKYLGTDNPGFWIGFHREYCDYYLWTGPRRDNTYRGVNFNYTDQTSNYLFGINGKDYDFINVKSGMEPRAVICRRAPIKPN